MTWLTRLFTVEEFSIDHFSSFFLEYLNNLTYMIRKNRSVPFDYDQRMIGYDYDINSYSYMAYRLLSTNCCYLQHMQEPYNNCYVVFEKETGYITTNSPWLSLVMKVVQGVSHEEYENNTISWVDYCSSLDHLINGDY